jgi:hypothetical protein
MQADVLDNFYSSFKYINQALVLFFWQRLEKVRQRWQNEKSSLKEQGTRDKSREHVKREK